jgi:hypothetical protein
MYPSYYEYGYSKEITTYIKAVFHANLWLSGYSSLVSSPVCHPPSASNVTLLTITAGRPSQLIFHHDISADYFAWYVSSTLDVANINHEI